MVAEAQREARDPSLRDRLIPPGPRLRVGGRPVRGREQGFGDRLLIDSLTFKLPRGGIVGVIGPNGAGKTTLFRMIMGTEQPDKGSLTIGETVKLAYVDQSRDALAADKNITRRSARVRTCCSSATVRSTRARTCRASTSRVQDQQKKVGILSGGERNRVHLAR